MNSELLTSEDIEVLLEASISEQSYEQLNRRGHNDYTIDQINILKSELRKGRICADIAKEYADIWNRGYKAMQQKLYTLKAKINDSSHDISIPIKHSKDPFKEKLTNMLKIKVKKLEKLQEIVNAIMVILNSVNI